MKLTVAFAITCSLHCILLVHAASSQGSLCSRPVRQCLPGVDYFPNKVTFQFSSTIKDVVFNRTFVDFTISSDVTASPFVTFKQTIFKYRLVPCGCESVVPPPPLDRQLITTNPIGVYISEGPILGLQQVFPLDPLIFTGPAEFIFSPRILDRIAKGKAQPISSGNLTPLNESTTLSLSLLGTFSVGPYVSANVSAPYLVIGEVSERTPLGRAEYLKLFGLLYTRVPFANWRFTTLKWRYMRVRKLAFRAKTRPTVFFNYPFGDSWTQPGGPQFPTQFVRDGNARYKFMNDDLSRGRQLTLEEIVGNFNQTDVLINSAFFPLSNNATIDEYIMSGNAAFQSAVKKLISVQTRMVWSNSKRISANKQATDFFESAIVMPDVLLNDYVQIFHPELFKHRDTFYMYRYLA